MTFPDSLIDCLWCNKGITCKLFNSALCILSVMLTDLSTIGCGEHDGNLLHFVYTYSKNLIVKNFEVEKLG